jgi:hypothetical protein
MRVEQSQFEQFTPTRDRQEESLLATKVPEHFTSRQNHNLLQFDKKSGGKNSTQILGERRQKKG